MKNSISWSLMTWSLLLISASAVVATSAAAGTLPWVTVGDPNNIGDVGSLGSVPYTYQISSAEVTNTRYAEFLNAVATTDANLLYSASMDSSPSGGIVQSGSAGSWVYTVKAGFEEKPVNFVSFYDTLRFVNWLHNGQPVGAQDSTTTEDGAYTITGAGIASNSIFRNATAKVFLPFMTEWHKAAYYDTATQSYFDYPAGTDTQTVCASPTSAANRANCWNFVGTVTDAGAYTASLSPNRTFDQGGNVEEWLENTVSGSARRVRGGSFRSAPIDLAASTSGGSASPFAEDDGIGFRVARKLQGNSAAPKMYFTNGESFIDDPVDTVIRAELDGTGAEILYSTATPSPGRPAGIAIDPTGGKLYWTLFFGGVIQRANLDGSGVEDLVASAGASHGIALDVPGGKMYWVVGSPGSIKRANLDGSSVETLLMGLDLPADIALDLGAGKMYWVDPVAETVERANLDGTAGEVIVSGLDFPSGIALDLPNGQVYWSEPLLDKIQRAALDGSGLTDVLTGLGEPGGIALDLPSSKIYWIESGSDKVRRASLDGSNVEDLVTSGLNSPNKIALHLIPAAPVPALPGPMLLLAAAGLIAVVLCTARRVRGERRRARC